MAFIHWTRRHPVKPSLKASKLHGNALTVPPRDIKRPRPLHHVVSCEDRRPGIRECDVVVRTSSCGDFPFREGKEGNVGASVIDDYRPDICPFTPARQAGTNSSGRCLLDEEGVTTATPKACLASTINQGLGAIKTSRFPSVK